jgi:hypothetical protein
MDGAFPSGGPAARQDSFGDAGAGRGRGPAGGRGFRGTAENSKVTVTWALTSGTASHVMGGAVAAPAVAALRLHRVSKRCAHPSMAVYCHID